VTGATVMGIQTSVNNRRTLYHKPYMIRYLPPTRVGNGNVLTLVCLSVLGSLVTTLCWSFAFSDDLDLMTFIDCGLLNATFV